MRVVGQDKKCLETFYLNLLYELRVLSTLFMFIRLTFISVHIKCLKVSIHDHEMMIDDYLAPILGRKKSFPQKISLKMSPTSCWPLAAESLFLGRGSSTLVRMSSRKEVSSGR